MYSEISAPFLDLRKASASSMNRTIPLFYFSAQSNRRLSSVTATGPRGAMSEPTITAYSIPDSIANFFAKRVLPVPGGP